jgi:3'-5' exoribonuclease
VDESKVDADAFQPRTKEDIEELWTRMKEVVEALENAQMKRLLTAILDDEKIARDFKRCPAAVNYHQSYIGGLLEHTVKILEMGVFVCEQYPRLNRDLLLAGIILHDIGKTREMKYDGPFEYTDPGKLLGHLVIGVMMIQEKMRDLPDFPEDLRDVLYHLILSHHGEYEWGSPKLPMTPEALALHHLDNLDAKVEASGRAIETDRLAESSWTEYNQMFKRELYKGPAREVQE